MHVEITKEAFNAIKGSSESFMEEPLELAIETYYLCKGVVLIEVFNHIVSITQYYIQDINA